MIENIIHFTIPKNPNDSQLTNISLARKLHPDWEIKVWQDPIDTTDFRLSKYWKNVNSGAQLADLVRIEVLHRFGGIYLDSDVKLCRPLDSLRSLKGLVISTEDGAHLTNAFIAAEKGNSLLDSLIFELDKNEPDWKLPPNFTTGPYFFTQQLKWAQELTLLPKHSFYPYNWNERRQQPNLFTFGVHLWEYSWGRSFKNRIFHITKNFIVLKIKDLFKRFMDFRSFLVLRKKVLSYSSAEFVSRESVHGYTAILRGDDLSVTPHFVRNGFYEWNEELFLRKILKPGDHVVDVGANVGLFTLLAATRIGTFGRVYAFEPNPRASDCLKRATVSNWLHDRVKIIESAVGQGSGETELSFSSLSLGGASAAAQTGENTFIGPTRETIGHVQTIKIPMTSLDSYFPTSLGIRFLKIDVEGFEIEVLNGAKRLLSSKCFEYIMLEVLPEIYGSRWKDFKDQLKAILNYGYELTVATKTGALKAIPPEHIFERTVINHRNVILRRI